MSVIAVKKKYEVAKKDVADCQRSIQQLQAKVDSLSESLPGLSRAVKDAEKAKTEALDAFALKSDKTSEDELKRARTAYEQTVKQQIETNELTEATGRALKRQTAELSKLQAACDLARRELWLSVFNETKAAIPEAVYDAVQALQVIGSQTGMARQWILDSLFPNSSTEEHQELQKGLCKKFDID